MKKKDIDIVYLDEDRFANAKQYVCDAEKGLQGIGTYSEKTLHSVLKNYYEPDLDYQEVAIDGYVADICRENEIVEIQTANFNKLRGKLDCFLENYIVKVVYPIPYRKWLTWIDEETGELNNRRKSPKKGTPYVAFYELYKIKKYLSNPNLRLELIMLDMEEYRLLNGWSNDRKRGSHRYDRIPLGIVQTYSFENVRDYLQLLPYELEEEFSTKNYAKITGLTQSRAVTAINVLYSLGVIERVRKKGNLIIYRVIED